MPAPRSPIPDFQARQPRLYWTGRGHTNRRFTCGHPSRGLVRSRLLKKHQSGWAGLGSGEGGTPFRVGLPVVCGDVPKRPPKRLPRRRRCLLLRATECSVLCFFDLVRGELVFGCREPLTWTYCCACGNRPSFSLGLSKSGRREWATDDPVFMMMHTFTCCQHKINREAVFKIHSRKTSWVFLVTTFAQ